MLEFVVGLVKRIIAVAVFWIALASLSHALDNAGWAYANYLLVALLAHITIILAVLWISQPEHLQSPVNAVTCLTALVLFVVWPVVKLDGGIAVTFFERQYGVLAGSGFDRLLFAIVSLTEDILPWCLLVLSALLIIGNIIRGILYVSDHRKQHPRSIMVSFENRQGLGERKKRKQGSSVEPDDVHADSNANPLDVFKS
ncbi:hypothetical protein WG622_18000 [Cognatishimia sp. D5M38]|uniref:Uncharacterized protein n=1 Tax=Cognatishimia coralii TaxID=3083254 RepID=A0ABU8QL73_9RHOB